MNGASFLAVLAIKIGEIIQVGGCGRLVRGEGRQGRLSRQEFLDEGKIVGHIGKHEKFSSPNKNAGALAGKFLGEHPPLVVTFLPPRIRKINMDGLDGAIRNAIAKEDPGIGTSQSNVDQAALGEAIGREELILALNLDAEEIGLRPGLSGAQ